MGLSIRNVSKRLGNFQLSLNLEVKEGELLSLLGPSGCGKTTTLRLVAGIEEPDSGSILVDGKDITSLPANLREVGMVFQNHALFPHMNVYRNIAYGPKSRKMEAGKIEETAAGLLELVGLAGFEKRSIHQLSGGEQQRVALARALATGPRLILFDEPLSSLDVQLKTRLRKELRRIQQTLGITALYVTHDQEEALAVSDKIAVLKDGKIEQIGTPEQLYRSPATSFTAAFIGTSNQLPGKVTGISNNTYTVETQIGDIEAEMKNGEIQYNKGDSVLLFFRPDGAALQEIEDTKIGSKTGRITGMEYQGKVYLAEVTVGPVSLLIEIPSSHRCRIGEEVGLHIKPGAGRLYPASES